MKIVDGAVSGASIRDTIFCIHAVNVIIEVFNGNTTRVGGVGGLDRCLISGGFDSWWQDRLSRWLYGWFCRWIYGRLIGGRISAKDKRAKEE